MSIHDLVAQFLHSHNYHETLKKFEEEHGNPLLTNLHDLPTNESLEDIYEDRIKFKQLETKVKELSLNDTLNEDLKQVLDMQIKNWSTPYPKITHIVDDPSMGLVVSCELFHHKYVLLGTVDMNFIVVDLDTGTKVFEEPAVIGKVVIKAIVCIDNQRVMLVGMNGKASIVELDINKKSVEIIGEFQLHKKLIVDAKYIKVGDTEYVVSLGWDFHIRVFEIEKSQFRMVDEFKLSVQGSCFDVTAYNGSLAIVFGKNEFTVLEVLSLVDSKLQLMYKISLNDAVFLTSMFTPRSIKIFHTSDSVPLIAVGTSHEPYMRVIVVTLSDFATALATPIRRDQIIKNLNTMSPQDKFLTAVMSWRLDGTGLWVLGEDGVARGLDLEKEEVVIEQRAHRGKIKAFVNGAGSNGQEVAVTCGTDRTLKVWK